MNKAFSLVELSIVLVILGLLTGGILAGQSLIRASEIRSVTTQFSQYVTAVQTFRDKYMALPGDMKNASSFWGALGTGTCPTGTGTGTQTCDGDGDGQIDPTGNVSRYGEDFTFWQHLGNAGLIEGSYTGKSGSASSLDATIGVNSPASKVSSAGWGVLYVGTSSGSTFWFDGAYSNVLRMGSKNADGSLKNPMFKAEEAWGVDTKLDDGKPGVGYVVVNSYSSCTDAANSAATGASYLLSSTASNICTPAYRNSF